MYTTSLVNERVFESRLERLGNISTNSFVVPSSFECEFNESKKDVNIQYLMNIYLKIVETPQN